MKKTFLIASAIIFIGCKQDPHIDYAVISGKIKNKPVGEVSINSLERTFTKSIDFSEDGTFKDTIKTDINTNTFVLYDGTNPVFLHIEPGTDLNITYDATDFDNTIAITGKGSAISNYLIAKRKIEMANFGNAKDTYSLDEDSFKAKLKTIKKQQDSILNNSKGISEDYIANEMRNTHYFYLRLLIDYEAGHKHFTTNKDFKVSDDFLSELNDIDYQNEEDFNFSRYYKALTENHYKKEAKELSKAEDLSTDDAYFEVLNTIDNETIKNGLLFDFANASMGHSKDIKAFYERFKSNSTNKKNNELIEETYNKLTAVAIGRPSPKFVNYENYAGGTTSLDDLKGKYVYIDVWATWCGPCKREIPFLKDIEKKYHGKNIEFVSLSIDKVSDREKWKSTIADESLGGIQLLADNDWKSSFVTDYQINGIPRFILIDNEGNILDPNAPRPSSNRLDELFSTLDL